MSCTTYRKPCFAALTTVVHYVLIRFFMSTFYHGGVLSVAPTLFDLLSTILKHGVEYFTHIRKK